MPILLILPIPLPPMPQPRRIAHAEERGAPTQPSDNIGKCGGAEVPARVCARVAHRTPGSPGVHAMPLRTPIPLLKIKETFLS
ncbi:hypothetical protein [Paraburkholderia oxyphila]|uniref:hypothetical protein n=1 Tax=Paraburkholderia oxyphila TaxID=614212 RepID=UPI000482783A|nr:hypothetical protein [Paraburkholderia oxyphila]